MRVLGQNYRVRARWTEGSPFTHSKPMTIRRAEEVAESCRQLGMVAQVVHTPACKRTRTAVRRIAERLIGRRLA